ncbi:hypothetical protein TNCV_2124921 [Trichonephila clavipes]|nr:hypothetical protein TNCV_2124921 [Trichonephila clavipes]
MVLRDGRTAGFYSSIGEVSRAAIPMFLVQDAVVGLKIAPSGMSRTKMPNSLRAVEFWAFHPISATFNSHCPVHWKPLRYPFSSSVELSCDLELVPPFICIVDQSYW